MWHAACIAQRALVLPHPHRRQRTSPVLIGTVSVSRCGGQFFNGFFGTWDLGPGHKPDISLKKYKTVIKLLVAATIGCQGAKN
jgi:hypothetical protein